MAIDPTTVRALIELAKEFHLARLQVEGVDIYTTPATFPPAPDFKVDEKSLGVYDNLEDVLSDPDLYLS
jgi:hypothetical protein